MTVSRTSVKRHILKNYYCSYNKMLIVYSIFEFNVLVFVIICQLTG